jgi:hypothetical protein
MNEKNNHFFLQMGGYMGKKRASPGDALGALFL